jgi:hypothetical protein
MTAFTDELWVILAEEHGASTLIVSPRPRRSHSSRRFLPAAAFVAVVAAVAAAALGTFAGRAQPAYAIQASPDGTVTLTLNEVIGITGANAALAKLGLPIVVARYEPRCAQTGEHAPRADQDQVMTIVETTPPQGDLQSLRWIIHPQRIPSGDVLRLVARFLPSGQGHALGVSYTLFRGTAPACAAGPAE